MLWGKRKAWLLPHLAPGVSMEFPKAPWFPRLRLRKVKQDSPSLATKYKNIQIVDYKGTGLCIPLGAALLTLETFHYVFSRVVTFPEGSWPIQGTLSVQCPLVSEDIVGTF